MQFALNIALLSKYCEDNNLENPYKIIFKNPFTPFINFVKRCFKK